MENITPYIQRDISWLSFNYRVLQEAKDESVPLLERIKFMAIYSSNLDEFFRVRVANHKNLYRLGRKAKKELDFEPELVLKQLLQIVNEQQMEFSHIFKNDIFPELVKNGIYIVRANRLTQVQKEFIEDFFKNELLPFVQPVLLVKNKIKPFLNNGSLYLAVQMYDHEASKHHRKKEYAIVKVPSDHMQRFVVLPSPEHQKHIILLDDVVRFSLRWIFPGYDIKESYSIKLTRDAELYIDDEFSGDLMIKVRRSLQKRNVGPASRLVYDRKMPKRLLDFLQSVFELSELDLLPEGRYHNNFDFFKFPDFGNHHLKDSPLEPLPIPSLEQSKSIFEAIKKKDHLVFVPFHSYESIIKFFEDASVDPDVTHIKILQYRVASSSRIMKALMKAVRRGKQVFAFIEIKARFDEEANLDWGERLEEAGINVQYSMPGLKVHSKTAIIRRLENGKPRTYSLLSTGNFNEDTAKLYSDITLLTANPALSKECLRLFSFLETKKPPNTPFKHLLVGQFGLKQRLIDLVKAEIRNAQAGKHAEIILKMNSLEDKEMIQLLYKASQAGVIVKLIIRGICSLVPGVSGISENIHAVSIIDRFLEHSRVFIFHNNGQAKYYLSSADWMRRNLHKRVEAVFPIYDEDLQKQLDEYIKIQLKDNVKSRRVEYQKTNEYYRDEIDLNFRSQIDTYYFIKRITL